MRLAAAQSRCRRSRMSRRTVPIARAPASRAEVSREPCNSAVVRSAPLRSAPVRSTRSKTSRRCAAQVGPGQDGRPVGGRPRAARSRVDRLPLGGRGPTPSPAGRPPAATPTSDWCGYPLRVGPQRVGERQLGRTAAVYWRPIPVERRQRRGPCSRRRSPAIDWPRKSSVSGLGTGIATRRAPPPASPLGEGPAQVAGQEVLEQRPVAEGERVALAGEECRGAEVGLPQVGRPLAVVALQVGPARRARPAASRRPLRPPRSCAPDRHSPAAICSISSCLCSGSRLCLPLSRSSQRSTNSP